MPEESRKNREKARGRFVALAGVVSLLAVLTASAFVFSSFDINVGGDLALNPPAVAVPATPPKGVALPPPLTVGKPGAGKTLTRIVMSSDPQYPWVEEKLTPGLDWKVESRRLILQRYHAINAFHALYPVDAVFENGDLTAFGHGWQIDTMKQFLSVLQPPVYLGLGNHDYENNVGNCMGDACAINSVAWFYAAMLGKVDRFDAYKRAYYEFPLNRTTYSGSLAYAKSFGNIHVIQINNRADYELALTGDLGATELDIGSALPWLEDELSWARANGMVIVVAMHIPARTPVEFDRLMDRYEVTAIFAGDLHAYHGWFSNAGDTPVLVSGSASYGTYLIAEFDDALRELRVYKVKDNDPFDRERTYTFPYREPKRNLPPILPKPAFAIKVNNEGGYNAKYRLRYDDATGQPVEAWSGELKSGQGHAFQVPGNASNLRFYGEARTGLLWAMWKTIFDERLDSMSHCFQTWGTTLSPKSSKQLCGHTGKSWTFLQSTLNDQCLDIRNGVSAGNELITWPCHGGKNQVFEFVGETIQVGGYCLDVAHNQNRKAQPVVLWRCTGQDNQRWTLEGNGRIRSLMPGPQRCLDVIAEEGNRVGLWDCHATSVDQRFGSTREFMPHAR